MQELSKTKTTLRLDKQSPNLELNPEPAKYEAGVLTTMFCSVFHWQLTSQTEQGTMTD
jgi:hypothetical protein